MVKAVVGANWGDEGKGKIVDMLADEAEVVIRFQGGANAGHTIVNDYGKFALHTLPSGVFHQNIVNVIGNGVALDLHKVGEELAEIESRGVPAPRLMISDRCQIVMPYHKLFDQYEEERLAGRSYGSTKSGIAPFYSDKYAKIGFQVSELFEDEKELRAKVENICVLKNTMLVNLYGKEPLSPDDLMETLREYRDIVAPCRRQPYLEATQSYQPTRRGRPVVAPYSPPSPPRLRSSSASSPKISETNSPAPTAEEYALLTVMTWRIS